jgi:hypothetical protein
VGYVDLQRRREEQTRGGANFRRGYAPNPYIFSTVGFGLATPASWISFSMLWYGSSLPAALSPLLPSVLFLALAIWQLWHQRASKRPEPGREKQLLVAIRDSGGMTPVEAAIETSLTVDEAEEILSRLSSRGHLLVESRDGALFYALPASHKKSS